ncbi:hypothetical protein AVEN_185435-1 [Araneus ventricosus]|uniref:Uncharacterized protein n=1 Tax=Araneus ventricosus TaxID=182803 RepID=A0A4Y2C3M6_ARAVE|nr:hypothetical protein AVEN_185435-1 [Araneus ventricosus]
MPDRDKGTRRGSSNSRCGFGDPLPPPLVIFHRKTHNALANIIMVEHPVPEYHVRAQIKAKKKTTNGKAAKPRHVGLCAADLTKNVDAAGESPVCSLVHRDKATEAAKQKTENNGNQGHTKEIPIK